MTVSSDIHSDDGPDELHELAKHSCHDGTDDNENEMVSGTNSMSENLRLISYRNLAIVVMLLSGVILLLLIAPRVSDLNIFFHAAADQTQDISDIRSGDVLDELYHSSKQSCVCGGKCVCHHNDNCPIKAKYRTMNPDCPCSYGEYYRRVSTSTGAGASSTDPPSSNYSGDFFTNSRDETPNSKDELAKSEERDRYESWDSSLATIGSVETTIQDELKSEFERRVETFDDQEAEEVARDDASIRPGMRRSQSATPETAVSEDGSAGAKSELEQQSRDDLFVPKMVRKTTTLPISL
jgi:hypothetical protein